MGKNDIVYAMMSDLKTVCETVAIDVDIYSSKKRGWYIEDFSKNKVFPVRILDHEKIVSLVEKHHPDFVVCNAGGLTFSQETFSYLNKKSITTIGISLSDPDVFEDQGKNYAQLFDLFFTNSQYSLEKQYNNFTNVSLLPFAASDKIHRPVNIKKTCDIVVVGHSRNDRKELVSKLQQEFSVKTFGKGWSNTSKEVQGERQVRAINEGRIYLSFPQTLAGFINVKVGVFEAAACRSCIVIPYFPELEKYFIYGLDVLGYTDYSMLCSILRTYLKNEKLRSWIASNAYEHFKRDHTWEKRWKDVVKLVKRVKHG